MCIRDRLLTERLKDLRLERSKLILNWLNKKKNASKVKIFSNKKMFYVDQAFNRRNNRCVVAPDAEAIPVMRTKHPQGVMVLGVVASDGKAMPPYFFKNGLMVNTEVYMKVLRYHVIPWIRRNYPKGNYVWQQDGAPAHKPIKTQQYLEKHTAEHWPKMFWPPSSPDLNPLDYSVWSVIEAKACAKPHGSVEDLKTSIRTAWTSMSKEYVVKTCKAF